MARLYLFAIGGTGARVLRSLTHILAAGATLRDHIGRPMDLVPLVIDPDAENGDTLDCLGGLVGYTDLRARHLGADYTGTFFGTRIQRYQELRADTGPQMDSGDAARREQESFRCGIVDRERVETFAKVVGYDNLSQRSQLLMDALYSRANLDTKLSGGFLGNPNIGTIVLNKVKTSEQFRMLPGLFHEDDRIFVISSIFGGTGASGFPVLLKLLRGARNKQGHEMTVLRDASIGALTVLPYFSVMPQAGSPIDSNAFVPKTKAALAYYSRHLGELDALYYVGDKARHQYPNAPTGVTQNNADHLIEFLGATSVLHFAARADGNARQDPAFECAVAGIEANGPLNLASLGNELAESVGAPLAEFALASRFLSQATQDLPRLLSQPWVKDGGFGREFFATDKQGTSFFTFDAYARQWRRAFERMAGNEPAFRPFGETLADLRRDRGVVTLNVNEMNKTLNSLYGYEYGPEASLQRLLGMTSEAATRLHGAVYGSGVVKA